MRGGREAQSAFNWRRDGLVAGVDEAGRGPLAGPVVAAAVILDPARPIEGLDDSKRLRPERRRQLARCVEQRSLAWGLGWADAAEIDTLNILQATMLAMRRALIALPVRPAHVEVDGNRCPGLEGLGFDCSAVAVVGGDGKLASISAASILAKVARDRFMVDLDRSYPGYEFATHKGYPTPLHLASLDRLGPSPVHRRSFAPVQCRQPRPIP